MPPAEDPGPGALLAASLTAIVAAQEASRVLRRTQPRPPRREQRSLIDDRPPMRITVLAVAACHKVGGQPQN